MFAQLVVNFIAQQVVGDAEPGQALPSVSRVLRSP
jgi:hypothetical protein